MFELDSFTALQPHRGWSRWLKARGSHQAALVGLASITMQGCCGPCSVGPASVHLLFELEEGSCNLEGVSPWVYVEGVVIEDGKDLFPIDDLVPLTLVSGTWTSEWHVLYASTSQPCEMDVEADLRLSDSSGLEISEQSCPGFSVHKNNHETSYTWADGGMMWDGLSKRVDFDWREYCHVL
jgi:hypothetical protein